MNDIFHDVDEALRRDKYTSSLRRFGPYILAGVVAIIAGAGFSQVWKSRQTDRANAAADQYDAAERQSGEGRDEETLEAFQTLSSEVPRGYQGLAYLQTGALYLKKQDKAAALSSLDKALESFKGQTALIDFTRLKAAYIAFETSTYEELQTRLTPLMIPHSSFKALAQELLAAKALAGGEYEKARDAYQALDTVPDLPRAAQQRVLEAKAHLRRLEAEGTLPPRPSAEAPETPHPSQPETGVSSHSIRGSTRSEQI